MPRDIQEALFEMAMKGQPAEREELARLLHEHHPRTMHPPRRQLEGLRRKPDVNKARASPLRRG